MPAATVASRSTGVDDTAATTHTITKPSGLSATQGVLVCFTWDTATATASTSSSGWTLLDTQAQGTTTNHSGAIFWAANGATAANLVVTLSTAQSATYAVLVINDPGTPEEVGANGSAATAVTLPALTTSATGDYLAIEYIGSDSSTTTTQTLTASTGFSNLQSQNPGVTTSAATFTAERSYTAVSSIAPANATLGSSEQWIAFTIGFPGTVTSGGGGSGGPPTIRAASAASNTTGNLAVTKPAGLAVGDLLIGWHIADNDGALASMGGPSGWTLLGSAAGAASGAPYEKVWTKVADSTDVAASTFTFTDSSAGIFNSAVVAAIAGGTFDPATPTGAVSFASSATSSTAHVAPSVTGVANGLLCTSHGTDSGGAAATYTPPSGMTEQADTNGGTSSFTALEVATLALAAAGATGTQSATCTVSRPWQASALVVNPAPVAASGFFFAQEV